MDVERLNEAQDLPGSGPGQPMQELQSLLGPEGNQCRISETLNLKTYTPRIPQASSAKLRKIQAASFKPQAQAASLKLQAASGKLHNFFALIKFHATRSEVLR